MKELQNGYFSLETEDYADSMREHLKLDLVSTLKGILLQIRHASKYEHKSWVYINQSSEHANIKAHVFLKAARHNEAGGFPHYVFPDEDHVYKKNVEVYQEITSHLKELGYSFYYDKANDTFRIYW